MLFSYRALKNNQMVRGKIEAYSQDEAVVFLKEGGYFPVEIKEIRQEEFSFVATLFREVSEVEIVNFTRQLSIMMNAGITLVNSLDIIRKQTRKRGMRKLVSDLDNQIRSGKSFSDSLEKYPMYFSRYYIALVKAGESSGKMYEIFNKLADTLEKQHSLRGKLKGALIYPFIIMMAMVAVIVLVMVVVLPNLSKLYTDFDVVLPPSTQMLVATSDAMIQWWYVFLVGGIVCIVGFERIFKSEKGKYYIDHITLHMPVISNIIQMSLLVDASRTLSTLIASGVSILDSFSIVREIVSNMAYQEAFGNVRMRIEKGTPIDKAMEVETIFPPIFIHMVTVGVQSGHLDDTLNRISTYFENESDMAIKQMTTLIEPVIIIFLGVVVGFIVFSIITPIYDLTGSFN